MTNYRWRIKRWVIYLRDTFPFNSILKRENENFRQLLEKAGGTNKRILDLGVGTGNVLRQLNKKNEIFGVDFTYSMLKMAKKHCPHAHLVRADVNALPFKSNSFDLVTAVGLLEYIHDSLPLLTDVCRILKENGHFILTFAPKNLWSSLRILLGHRIRMRKVDHISSITKTCDFKIIEIKRTLMQIQVLAKKSG